MWKQTKQKFQNKKNLHLISKQTGVMPILYRKRKMKYVE